MRHWKYAKAVMSKACMKARAGVIPEFTGISAPYEAPINPEITVNTAEHSLEECVQQIRAILRNKGFVQQ